jgi:hypothetical protein
MTARILLSMVMMLFASVGALKGAPSPDEAAAKAELLKAKTEAARKAYEITTKFIGGIGTKFDPEKAYLWSRRWLESECAATTDKEKRLTALKDHRQRMRDLKIWVNKLIKEGVGGVALADSAGVDYYLAEADLWTAHCWSGGRANSDGSSATHPA